MVPELVEVTRAAPRGGEGSQGGDTGKAGTGDKGATRGQSRREISGCLSHSDTGIVSLVALVCPFGHRAREPSPELLHEAGAAKEIWW